MVSDTFPGSELYRSVKALAKQFTLQYNTGLQCSECCPSRCRWQKHRYVPYCAPCNTYGIYIVDIIFKKRYTEVMIE